jgi:hypothetical protein
MSAENKEVGLKFFNYGEAFPGDTHMTIVLEIDGAYAGTYRGVFDGNVVRCSIDKRAHDLAPRRADVSPEYMVRRRGQPIPPEHRG